MVRQERSFGQEEIAVDGRSRGESRGRPAVIGGWKRERVLKFPGGFCSKAPEVTSIFKSIHSLFTPYPRPRLASSQDSEAREFSKEHGSGEGQQCDRVSQRARDSRKMGPSLDSGPQLSWPGGLRQRLSVRSRGVPAGRVPTTRRRCELLTEIGNHN